MKVTLYMAMSANGMIARESGEEDFLSDINWKTFKELAEKIGCFIVGRKTYDAVQQWKEYTFDDIKAKRIIVSRSAVDVKEGYTLANSPEDALEKAEGDVLLTGGGTINSAFMKAGLVNEIILNVEPFVLGKGISVFAEDDFEKRLELVDMKKLNDGIVQLRYKVKE